MAIENREKDRKNVAELSDEKSDIIYELDDPVNKIKIRYNLSELDDPKILNAIVDACRRRYDENPTRRGTSRQERVITAALARLSQLGFSVFGSLGDSYLQKKKENNNV